MIMWEWGIIEVFVNHLIRSSHWKMLTVITLRFLLSKTKPLYSLFNLILVFFILKEHY